MPTATSERAFMTLQEASAYSTLSEMTIRRLEQAGKLQLLRPSPRRVLVDRQELDAYLRGCVA